jgi:hypothetical protein
MGGGGESSSSSSSGSRSGGNEAGMKKVTILSTPALRAVEAAARETGSEAADCRDSEPVRELVQVQVKWVDSRSTLLAKMYAEDSVADLEAQICAHFVGQGGGGAPGFELRAAYPPRKVRDGICLCFRCFLLPFISTFLLSFLPYLIYYFTLLCSHLEARLTLYFAFVPFFFPSSPSNLSLLLSLSARGAPHSARSWAFSQRNSARKKHFVAVRSADCIVLSSGLYDAVHS